MTVFGGTGEVQVIRDRQEVTDLVHLHVGLRRHTGVTDSRSFDLTHCKHKSSASATFDSRTLWIGCPIGISKGALVSRSFLSMLLAQSVQQS